MRGMLAVMALGVAVPMAAQSRSGADMAPVAWLAGCWELRSGARVTQEQWMAPAGGMMLGMSRTVVRDTVREYEHLRLELREGKLTYVALPSGQKEAAFTQEEAGDSGASFVNPEHDFPQRISYRRVGADSLIARIEGTRGGQPRGIDFPMKRGCRA